jgi:hypothetical protein
LKIILTYFEYCKILSAISTTDTRRRKKDLSSLPYKAIEKELKMQLPSDVAEMHVLLPIDLGMKSSYLENNQNWEYVVLLN